MRGITGDVWVGHPSCILHLPFHSIVITVYTYVALWNRAGRHGRDSIEHICQEISHLPPVLWGDDNARQTSHGIPRCSIRIISLKDDIESLIGDFVTGPQLVAPLACHFLDFLNNRPQISAMAARSIEGVCQGVAME